MQLIRHQVQVSFIAQCVDGAKVMDFSSANMQKAQADLGLLADTRGLDKLRQMGTGDRSQKAQALYQAAQQFESLLMQYWVDGMRSTNEEINPDSPLRSKYSGFFDDMLSQQQVGAMVRGNGQGASINKGSITYLITKQFARTLGDEGKALIAELEGRPVDAKSPQESYGLNQLENAAGSRMFALSANDPRYHGVPRPSQIFNSTRKTNSVSDDSGLDPSITNLNKLYASLPSHEEMRDFSSPEDFVEKMMPFALKAVEGIGMNPLVLVAQAALETGWGKHVPTNNNYYGIKAGGSWDGPVQELASDEFENGAMVKRNSKFRAYPSVLESMKDYVSLITGNDRYQKAAKKSFDPDTYFDEIQKAGYATDPNYASKLKNISRQIAFMAYKQHKDLQKRKSTSSSQQSCEG